MNIRNPVEPQRKIPPGTISSMMPKWRHSGSHSGTHNDYNGFKNTSKHCVDDFAWFS